MTRRRGAGSGGTSGGAPPAGKVSVPSSALPSLTLPSSGLASEILAALGSAIPAAQEPLPPPEEATRAVQGSDRLYSLVDLLTRRGSAAPEAAPETPEVWVTFEVGGEIYGLPVGVVEEVLRVTTITRLPYAPAPVRGITQLRGRVLPVVDLRVRLGLQEAPVAPQNRIVVVSSRGRTLGLLADAARQVVKLLPSTMEAPPREVTSERSDFIVAVCRRDESLVILLDVEKTLLLPEEDALGGGLPLPGERVGEREIGSTAPTRTFGGKRDEAK